MPVDKGREAGFKKTAEYFKARANRARNETDHEHHMDAARFYRELAAITPALPPHYETPKHIYRANRYRNRAEECRAIAAGLVDGNSKRQLADLAATYEQLATAQDRDNEVYIQSSGGMRRDTALLGRARRA